MLELQTGHGVEEGPAEEQDLLGGSHPGAAALRWNGDWMVGRFGEMLIRRNIRGGVRSA